MRSHPAQHGEGFDHCLIKPTLGGPIPQNMAKTALVRQPYSEAVLSTGGRLHPRFLRKRGLGRKWSSPCRRDGEVEKSAL